MPEHLLSSSGDSSLMYGSTYVTSTFPKDGWSQPPLVFYCIEVEGSTFRGQTCGYSPQSSVLNDDLGFDQLRMAEGEADVLAGRVLPFVEAMNALRARIHSDGD